MFFMINDYFLILSPNHKSKLINDMKCRNSSAHEHESLDPQRSILYSLECDPYKSKTCYLNSIFSWACQPPHKSQTHKAIHIPYIQHNSEHLREAGGGVVQQIIPTILQKDCYCKYFFLLKICRTEYRFFFPPGCYVVIGDRGKKTSLLYSVFTHTAFIHIMMHTY